MLNFSRWRASAASEACCGAPDARGRGDRDDQRDTGRARILCAASRRAAADLRRPGGDRDRERAPVQRDKEALERQTATAEILRVISGSITDTQPVFEAIVQSCRRLFGGKAVHLAMPRGDMIEDVAFASDAPSPKGVGFLKPWPLDRGSGAGTCILERAVIVVADTFEAAKQFPRMPDLAIALGYRSCLFVPLLKDGKALGSITILRETTGAFDDQEIALAETFADQAVIAIENVRLFNETKEALERQTATADILKVIASSPADVQPVLDAIANSSNRLMDGLSAAVTLIVDGTLHLEGLHAHQRGVGRSAEGSVSAVAGRPVRRRADPQRRDRPVHRHRDRLGFESSPAATARKRGFRSALWSPLMREGAAIGMISVTRVEPRLLCAASRRAAADLRRPGGDRDRERAPVQRDQGSARAADRDRRGPARDQRLGDRDAAGLRRHRRARRAPDRCETRIRLPLRRRADPHRERPRREPRGPGGCAQGVPDAPGDGVGHRARRRATAWWSTSATCSRIPTSDYQTLDIARFAGYRAVLAVPMLREREIVGAIAVTRAEPGRSPNARSTCCRPSPTRR